MFPTNACLGKYNKKICHRACLGDIMGQTYPFYACNGTNYTRHFKGSRYISLQLEAKVFKVTLSKTLIGVKSRACGTI